jgi:hypothetical protein
MDLSPISKAIAGGLVTLVVSFVAHYGWTLSPVVHDAVASISLAAVSYLVGHIVVYLAPKNKATV